MIDTLALFKKPNTEFVKPKTFIVTNDSIPDMQFSKETLNYIIVDEEEEPITEETISKINEMILDQKARNYIQVLCTGLSKKRTVSEIQSIIAAEFVRVSKMTTEPWRPPAGFSRGLISLPELYCPEKTVNHIVIDIKIDKSLLED